MTAPIQPGVGSPIISTPILRPTDVVREPGLDASGQNELPQLARLLMAKGQLALENEKFQAQQQQAKQKKQQLDLLGQHLSAMFANPQATSPENLPGTMGQTAAEFGMAGETGAAGRAVSDIPRAVQEQQAVLARNVVGPLINAFLQDPAHIRDPLAQAELKFHVMTGAGPEWGKVVSDALKPLEGNLKFPVVPGVGLVGLDFNKVERDAEGNVTKWPDAKVLVREPPKTGTMVSMQKRNDQASMGLQHIVNLEHALGSKEGEFNPNSIANIEPTKAAAAENLGANTVAKSLLAFGGVLGIGQGTPEAIAQSLRPPERQSYRLNAKGLVVNYSTWVGGSPRSMPLLHTMLETVDPPAGSSPEARQAAWTVIQQMKQAFINSRAGKPIEWEKVPFFNEIMADVAKEGNTGQQQQPTGGGMQQAVTAQDLLNKEEE